MKKTMISIIIAIVAIVGIALIITTTTAATTKITIEVKILKFFPNHNLESCVTGSKSRRCRRCLIKFTQQKFFLK